MRKFFVMVLAVATLCLSGLGARAEVPTLIPVVGVLTDTDDAPLDGDLSVVFTLYTDETGGMTLWGETQIVEFTEGLFQVYLGSSTIDGMDITDFVDNEDVWLGIRVGADSEMNRVRMATVPWAFEAATCGEVTDLAAAGIQEEIGADACEVGQAMRGWTGTAAQCVDLPSTAGLLEETDIGVTLQAPISQASFPCNYGIQQISAGGAVVCASQDVVTQCGPEAGLGSNDNYLGSDGSCHKAVHSCTVDEYLAGGAVGICYPAPHSCDIDEYLGSDGACHTASHACAPGEYLDGSGQCSTTGVLFPAFTSTGRNGIAAPVTGQMIYNTTRQTMEWYTGAAWASSVPAGSIQAFASGTVPAGWLLCNGAAVSRSTYADLFSAIGIGFGIGDGATTFNLPDMRGRFLRGVAHGSTQDPDRAARTISGTGGAAGDAIGSLQSHAYYSHGHTTNTAGAHTHTIERYADAMWDWGGIAASGRTDWSRGSATTSSDGDHTHVINASGGNETRPVNLYVDYIIKI